MMRLMYPLFSLIFLILLSACESTIQRDYVGLEIPASLQHDAKAVAYLEKDAKQLNRFFNSLDEMATEFESLAELINTVDTTDASSIAAAKPLVMKRVKKLNRAFEKIAINLMWYMGKDLFAGDSAPEEILKRLDTDEGVAFRKSMNHINLQKGLLKERAESFMANMEKLDIFKEEE